MARLLLVAGAVGLAACRAPEDARLAGEPDPETGAAPERAGQAPYVPGPGDGWARVEPADAGFDAAALQAAVDFALASETTMPRDPGRYLRDRFAGQRWQEIVGPTKERGGVNGILLKGGRIVAEWGDTRRPDMTFSVTKSYLSTVVGLARDDGLIPDLDAPVAELVDDGGFDSPHNASITWRHHLRQLSEWEGTLFGKPDSADRRRGVDRDLEVPGTFWEYNDVRVNRLALSALRLFERHLPEVLRERIMDPTGASDTWEWHGYETSWVEVGGRRVQSVSGGGHWGGGMIISTRDHARFGLLMLRRGRWGDARLLSEDWVDQALTPSLQPNYGFMWWLNTGREQFPNAPESSFFALGAGSTSTIWVDPENDLVLVSRWVDGPQVNELIGRILAARTDAVAATVGFAPSFVKVFPDPAHGGPRELAPAGAISMARNETEAVQLVVSSQTDIVGVAVRPGPLVGPEGEEIPPDDVEIRAVGYVDLQEPRHPSGIAGWHPDPLLPNRTIDLTGGIPRSFLVSVRTRSETSPGLYRGTLFVHADGTAEVPLEVRVWDIELPRVPRFKTASFADWGLPGRMWPRGDGEPARSDSARLEIMLSVAELGFDYRLPPTVFLANGLRSRDRDGENETRFGFPTHDPDGSGGGTFNPERTDRLIDYMLGRGANHFFLAVTSNVWRGEESSARRERLIAYLSEYAEHLRGRGLIDMAYVYNIDEPWGEEVREAKQTFTLIREGVGDDVRVMQNTNQTNSYIIPDLLGFFDVIDVNLGFHDATAVASWRERFPDRIDEVWWNVNLWPDTHPNLFIEFPLVDARIIGPMSYAHDVDGFEYWGIFRPYAIGNYHPVGADEVFVQWNVGSRSLDGTLVYPSESGEIWPSLRLASLRDGFEDAELLHLLEEADPDHALLSVPIVRGLTEFATDPDSVLAFRRDVAAALLAATRPEAALRP